MASRSDQDLNRDIVAIVLAFHRQDREALRALLAGYQDRAGNLRLLGAMSGLVTLCLEDILKMAVAMEGADGLEDVGFDVEDALQRMALRMAGAANG